MSFKGFYATAGWDPASGIGSVDYTKMKSYFLSLYNGPANYSVKTVRNFHVKIIIFLTYVDFAIDLILLQIPSTPTNQGIFFKLRLQMSLLQFTVDLTSSTLTTVLSNLILFYLILFHIMFLIVSYLIKSNRIIFSIYLFQNYRYWVA